MEEGKRLSEYIEKQGFTKKKFCEKHGFEYNNFTNMLADRRPIGIKVITQIHFALPKLNVHWLLFGEGPEEVHLENYNTLNEPKANYESIKKDIKNEFLEALEDVEFLNKIYERLQKKE